MIPAEYQHPYGLIYREIKGLLERYGNVRLEQVPLVFNGRLLDEKGFIFLAPGPPKTGYTRLVHAVTRIEARTLVEEVRGGL
tara:strand:- start:6393 stop:6638 length:246 start_codon:yes stop_codon:yes gene_type:complete